MGGERLSDFWKDLNEVQSAAGMSTKKREDRERGSGNPVRSLTEATEVLQEIRELKAEVRTLREEIAELVKAMARTVRSSPEGTRKLRVEEERVSPKYLLEAIASSNPLPDRGVEG